MSLFRKKNSLKIIFSAIGAFIFPFVCFSQPIIATPDIIINAMDLLPKQNEISPPQGQKPLLPHVEVTPSPRSGSFEEGSTFEVPILLNTKGASINGVEVRINFDKDKLSVISQSNGTSIIGIWVEPPRYDNAKGTVSYVGVIPNGITTESGFIGTITFKALSSGTATVSVNAGSRILLNDGLGTGTILDSGRAVYSILPKAPEGVRIYSETHPFQNTWYNNNNPVVSWDRDPGVDVFSFVLDNKPGTIPDNNAHTKETTTSFNNLADGLWYFHIKAHKDTSWGASGQFLMRIDTTPPADFKPEASYLMAAAILTGRTLITFFTTDNLSGIDHYEVGVIDKTQPATESPVFVQAESPFQLPVSENTKMRVIVRAVDKAGNIRDAFVDVNFPNIFSRFLQDYLVYLLLLIIFLCLLAFVLHYLFGHHILKHLRRALALVKKENQEEENQETNVPRKPLDY
jgi:hypothetical protein